MYKNLLFVLFLQSVCGVLWGINIGDKIPDFSLESGDCRKLYSSAISGKITFLFYDTKNTFERNIEFKENLYQEYLALSDQHRSEIEIVQIVDCSDTIFLSKFFWKKALLNNSKKYKLQLWGDWTGDFKQSYDLLDEESYLMIIDQKGRLLYLQNERFKPAWYGEITEVLNQALSEDKVR